MVAGFQRHWQAGNVDFFAAGASTSTAVGFSTHVRGATLRASLR
jgi:hypothetical protein